MGADALAAEALRVNARYLEEVVLGWGLCPFAARAIDDGQVRRWVLPDEAPTLAGVLSCVEEIAALPEVVIGLVIFPRVTLSLAAFDSFAEGVRRAASGRAFLIAAFHPFAAQSFTTAPELVSFLRRTPDPTLQLVRASVLQQLSPDLSAGIARQNLETAQSRGAAVLDALLRDIRRDRDESYARLGR